MVKQLKEVQAALGEHEELFVTALHLCKGIYEQQKVKMQFLVFGNIIMFYRNKSLEHYDAKVKINYDLVDMTGEWIFVIIHFWKAWICKMRVSVRSQWAWPKNTGSNHNAAVLHHLFLGSSRSTSSLDHIILSPVPSNFLLPSCPTTWWLMCDAYVAWDQSHVMTDHMILSVESRCPALISFSMFNTVLKQQVSRN